MKSGEKIWSRYAKLSYIWRRAGLRFSQHLSMKRFLFAIIFFSLPIALPAQTIEGKVCDARTGVMIAEAVVYMNGTTLVTTTDRDGFFKLEPEKPVHSNIVISHPHYATLIAASSSVQQHQIYYLSEKEDISSKAGNKSDRYTRSDKMLVFRELFLGTSQAGRSCVIENEEDVVLNYDYITNSLTGYARRPLIVDNKYLAYRLTYDLQSFIVRYESAVQNLSMAVSSLSSCLGTYFFTDLNRSDARYARRREKIYLASSPCFWKNFVANTLEQANFRIYNRNRQIMRDQYFIVSDDMPSQQEVMIASDTDLDLIPDIDIMSKGPVFGVLGVRYNKSIRSEIVFLTNWFSIDAYGIPNVVDDLIYSGYMGEQQALGDALPLDFKYESMYKPLGK